MPILIRPAGETDLSNASLHPDAALPQTIDGLAAGTWEVGRVAWADAPATVTAAGGGTAPLLLIVAGQSNARVAGNGGATPPAQYGGGALGATSILVKGTGIADAAFETYDVAANADPDHAGTAWGTEAEFVRRMRAAGDDRPVYVVKESRNGQTLHAQWHPDTSGDRFDDLEAKVARARALVPDGFGAEVVLWNQGEADANAGAGPGGAAHLEYAANFGDWFAALRARVSADAFVVVQRIRPLGYAGGASAGDAEGFARAWEIREAQVAVPLADGNAATVDTDFLPGNFGSIHPGEPWTEGMGARSHAAWTGTYDATYGPITDAVPDPFDFADLPDVAPGSTVTTVPVLAAGFERRAPVSIAGGEWRTLNSLAADAVVRDWTSGPGVLDKFQKIQLRQTAGAAAGETTTTVVTIGGVEVDWAVTTASGAGDREPETDAFIARVQAEGGTTLAGAQAQALDAFFAAAKGSTWWPKVIRLYGRLADETSSSLDLRDQATRLEVKVTTAPYVWSPAAGWSPQTNAHNGLDLKVDPSADLPQDSCAVGVFYSRLSDDTRGELNGGSPIYLRTLTNGSSRYRLASGANAGAGGLVTTPGLRAIVRDGPSAVALHGPDGTVIASAAVDSIPHTATALVLGRMSAGNLSGGGHSATAAFLGAFAANAALTEAEMQDFAARMDALHAAFAP